MSRRARARFVPLLLAASLPLCVPLCAARPASADGPAVEAVFVLDTTGSMSALLDGAVQRVWAIANQLAAGRPAPRLRLGLVAFRDRGDQYVTRVFEPTPDVAELEGWLRGLKADGGGDGPESVRRALHDALSRVPWSAGDGVYRTVFLVGDAPPHDYPDEPTTSEILALARQRGVVLNAIQCGGMPETRRAWTALASGGGGAYLALAPGESQLALETPFDRVFAALHAQLAETVVPFGPEATRSAARDALARELSRDGSARAARLSFLEKGREGLVADEADLVSAVRDGRVRLEELAESALPDWMRALPLEARRAWVAEQIDRREGLRSEIAYLARKREAHLRAEAQRRREAGEPVGFEHQLLALVREQAAARGIRYE
ncbi:MAG: VWA domain-containing protein [Myxococcota bacterium]|nr:VWA domain-containing protein [Myxococcota bacterium]